MKFIDFFFDCVFFCFEVVDGLRWIEVVKIFIEFLILEVIFINILDFVVVIMDFVYFLFSWIVISLFEELLGILFFVRIILGWVLFFNILKIRLF